MPSQSKDELLKFLDHAGNHGLMTKNSAQSLKSACTAVFAILGEDDPEDILALDLDDLFRRYENIKGMDVSPRTLRAYRQRVKQAISNFERYKANPSQWKPAGGQRSSSTGKRAPRTQTNNQEYEVDQQARIASPVLTASSADEITHQFPLRRDAIVRISGIPFDVTRSEMARMNAYLSNLVADAGEVETLQLMPGTTDSDIV